VLAFRHPSSIAALGVRRHAPSPSRERSPSRAIAESSDLDWREDLAIRSRQSWMRSLFAPIYDDLTRRSGDSIPALDGLRAIAALLIVLFHCQVWLGLRHAFTTPEGLVRSVIGYGWVGVDIFFVLSGFLIARALFIQAAHGGINFRTFYLRRSFRIFPSYYFVLTLSVFCFSRVHLFSPLYGGASFVTLLERSPFSYFYISNYAFPGTLQTPMSWSWSLCVEEHFYLLFPAVTAMIFRLLPQYRLRALVGLCFIPIACRAIAFIDNPAQTAFANTYFKSHTHTDGLMIGCVLAYAWIFYEERIRAIAQQWGNALVAVGLAGLVLAWWSGGAGRSGLWSVVLQFTIIGVSAGLIVLHCLYCQSGFSRFLSHAFWYPIARLSYGMYLVHLFPVVWLASVWPGGLARISQSEIQFILYAAASATLSLAAAGVLYFSFEYRLLAIGKRLSSRGKKAVEDVAPGRLLKAA
jgi:peptidoglycan/LPS O-acetylase OafA/YrhL